MQFLGFRILWRRIKAIRFMMADKTVKWWKKGIIVAGILFLLSPIDLIPIFIFPFNFIDDIVVWIFILWYLRKELDSYWMGEEGKDLSKKFRGKTMVDDVEYEVDDEGKKARKNAGKARENSGEEARAESKADAESAKQEEQAAE